MEFVTLILKALAPDIILARDTAGQVRRMGTERGHVESTTYGMAGVQFLYVP